MLLVGCIMLLILAGCSKDRQEIPPSGTGWTHRDVRALADPQAHTLIAAYTRITQTDVELRIDLLEPLNVSQARLMVALDTQAGGTTLSFAQQAEGGWDYLVNLPFEGSPSLTSLAGMPGGKYRARVLRPYPGSVVIRLSRQLIPEYPRLPTGEPMRMMAFLSPAAGAPPVDTLGPIRFDSPPPAQAPLLLVFWDTLPSITPAQALRRWDGAHTGPYGQRHGLKILLDSALRRQIPLVLLDLNYPRTLAVLQAFDGLDLVRSMQKEGLVLLPDLNPEPVDKSTDSYAKYISITNPHILYGSYSLPLPPGYSTAFAWLNDPGHLGFTQNTRLIPLPGQPGSEWNPPDPEINEHGLSIEVRRQLLQVAISADPGDLVVLGGSLPRSPWGDLMLVGSALDYIQNHPWIQPLTPEQMMTFPTQDNQPLCPDLICRAEAASESPLQHSIQPKLENAPGNLFNRLAHQVYQALTTPQSDARLSSLQSAYLGSAAYLISAAEWASAPGHMSTCSIDLDLDGSNECLLASEDVFLVTSTLGGRLVFAAAQTPSGPVQLIGPRSQLAVGLGDPRDWKPGQGLGADPQEIPGAFTDGQNPFSSYTVELSSAEIVFQSQEQGRQKRYQLTPGGFKVRISSQQPVITRLPLILLDEQVYQPGWLDRYTSSPPADTKWAWGMKKGACVILTTADAQLTTNAFTESRALLKQPENPNLAYPAGHFLPFPMALVEIHAQGDFTLDLLVTAFQKDFAGIPFGSRCIEQP